ncbi:MAG: PEGA domain-containing protein [candidate division WOR-3 bacterium]|nr:MAG: PEGA domain-containing protein [candidate division WOR-3 bacterium]
MSKRMSKPVLVLAVLLVCFAVALAAKTCPNCGASNANEAKFCKDCGYRFPTSSRPSRPSQPRVQVEVTVSGGLARIRSTPSGASVTVDGRSQGETPVNVSNLSPGRHELAASASGYRTYYGVFVIPRAEGTIAVTTDPVGAEVLLNGSSKGRAGESGLLLQDVQYGTHRLSARLDGYTDAVKDVTLTRDQPVSVTTLQLLPSLGVLRVESDPVESEVEVGGRPKGKTPYVGEMKPERYLISVSRRGYYDYVGYTNVLPGETTEVYARLLRLERKNPLPLIGGIALLAGGALSAYMGGTEYAKYETAENKEEARRVRQTTELWDWGRNIGIALGAAGVVFYFAF